MFVSHLYVFFGKCLFRSFPHFWTGLFVFLVLSSMSCLYILEINPLSIVSFAIIFSRSEGCLFTLLIVSFAVQKLLSLIRPQLFQFSSLSRVRRFATPWTATHQAPPSMGFSRQEYWSGVPLGKKT